MLKFRAPDFITFTGVDERTSIGEMADLAQQYPIEWGVLFSQTRQGADNRYPDHDFIERLLATEMRFSAHLCGQYARFIMDGREISQPVRLDAFSRIQVNHPDPDPNRILKIKTQTGTIRAGVRRIGQCNREVFPQITAVDWLFDKSGGTGVSPDFWPRHPGRRVGYAGGIGPDNVLAVLKAIGATGPYWIDMETKVRTSDRFDLGLCREVCELVYGGGNAGQF